MRIEFRKFYIYLITNPYGILIPLYVVFFFLSLFIKISEVDDQSLLTPLQDPIRQLFGANSRITANTIAFLTTTKNLVIWKIFTPFMLVLLIYCIARIVINEEKMTVSIKRNIIIFITLTFFYIYSRVITSSILWVAGSFCYLWPTSIGFFSILPFVDYLKYNKFNKKFIPLYCISAIYAAFAHEQTSALLISFSILLYIYSWVQKKIDVNKSSFFQIFFYTLGLAFIYPFVQKKLKINKYLIFQIFIYFMGLMFLLFYNANETRYAHEILRWYPEFPMLSFSDKLFRGSLWLLNHLYSKEKFLLIIIFLLYLIINMNTNKKSNKSFFLFFTLIPFSILLLSTLPIDAILNKFTRSIPGVYSEIKIDIVLSQLTSFDLKKNSISQPNDFFQYILWILYLIFLFVGIKYLSVNREKYLALFFILLASLGASFIMFFSPTMYASQHRVFFSMDILLVLFISLLYGEQVMTNIRIRFIHLFIYSIYPFLIYLTIIIKMWGSNSTFLD